MREIVVLVARIIIEHAIGGRARAGQAGEDIGQRGRIVGIEEPGIQRLVAKAQTRRQHGACRVCPACCHFREGPKVVAVQDQIDILIVEVTELAVTIIQRDTNGQLRDPPAKRPKHGGGKARLRANDRRRIGRRRASFEKRACSLLGHQTDPIQTDCVKDNPAN